MQTVIEVTPNPYSDLPAYSVQVPNALSGMYLKDYLDGSQPHYSNSPQLCQVLEYLNIEFDTIADYPKDDNTLRFLFDSEEDANDAAAVFTQIQSIKGL